MANSSPGVVKTYKLTYESVEVMHALFDRTTATNTWTVQSRLLEEFVRYFGPRTEHLDMYSEDHKATFTSFTEKIMDGKGSSFRMLYQSPLLATMLTRALT